jgi:twitching motility two-component system response regulator PilG
MQGNLNEIDIRSILQLIELGQRTGELFVEAYSGSYISDLKSDPSLGLHSSPSLPTRSWFVFFLNGQIIYATDSNTNLFRLRDYLRHYQIGDIIDNMPVSWAEPRNIQEYTYLWALLEHNFLTPSQARTIIHSIIQETLFDLLSLHQGTFIFESAPALTPQLSTLKISSAVTKIMQQVQQWKQLHPHISSLAQCPLIIDELPLQQRLNASTFNHLQRWADGQTSLQQLARHLNREPVAVARAIYPFIQKGWVQLVYPTVTRNSSFDSSPFASAKTPLVACIHQDLKICQVSKATFSQYPQKIEVVFLDDAQNALSRLFEIKPDLICCDLTSSSSALDSYDFCAMLRRSKVFRHTPIIVFSDRDLFMQRIKARMFGATEYLVAPVNEKQLLTLLEKYLNFSSIIENSTIL